MSELKLGYDPQTAHTMACNRQAAFTAIAQSISVDNPNVSTVQITSIARSSSTATMFHLAASPAVSGENAVIFQPAKAVLRHQRSIAIPDGGGGPLIFKDTWAPRDFETYDTQTALRARGTLTGIAGRLAISRLPLAAFASICKFVPNASAKEFINAYKAFEESHHEAAEYGIPTVKVAYDMMSFLPPEDYVQGISSALSARCNINLPCDGTQFNRKNVYQLLEGDDPSYYNEVIAPTYDRMQLGYDEPRGLKRFAQAHPEETSNIENELNPLFRQTMLEAAATVFQSSGVSIGQIDEFIGKHTYSS